MTNGTRGVRGALSLPAVAVLLAAALGLPQRAQAQTTYDLAQYVIPSCDTPRAYNTTVTGMRRFIPMGVDGAGRARYVYVTSGNGAAFLEFTIDGSQIRFWADASWAHDNHPPAAECPGSNYCDEVSGPIGVPTANCRCLWFHGWGSADYVYNAPRDAANENLGARFLPRSVTLTGSQERVYTVGSSVTRARRKSDCSATTSWHSSPPGTNQTSSVAISRLASHNGYNDVVRVRAVGGPGTGEIFYYARGFGWVGYESGGGYSDWITTATSAAPNPNLSCLAYGQGSFCSVVNPGGGGGGGCHPTVPAGSWTAQYYPNVNLSGSPTLTRNDGAGFLNVNWGSGGPNACGIGSDNFSVRWTRSASFNAGTHRFTVTSDDGFRFYVDNVLRLDRWFDQAPTTYTVDVPLTAGAHNLRLDWYERGGGAVAAISWTPVGGGGGGNNAQVLTAESSVPSALAPNETRQVRVRVRNTGGTTWSAGALYRLGAQGDNGLTWSAFPCGGYMNNLTDGRVYLCQNVAPNGTYDFNFNVRAPASGTPRLSVRMVRDGVEWFGAGASWPITVGGSNPYPSCPCSAGIDNYCLHGPSTPGCPMTSRFGYCDPNGDGNFADADWTRGYYEFQDYCR